MTETILVLNAGSSSIKFQLFAVDAGDKLIRRMKGQIDGIGTRPRLFVKAKDGETVVDQSWPASAVADAPAALEKAVTWLQQQLGGELPSAIGHRVAHGGHDFDETTMVDDGVLERLERLSPLAPLHQPNNLAPIRAIRARRPGLLQVACFDTAFHRGHTEVAQRYAIPDALYREGILRYGFHGLSYEYSRSFDSTMGFTALDGLPMVTRPGQIDPVVLLYLINANGWDAARLEHFLYLECGLKGLSGVSNDMRDLLASNAPDAKLAVDYFVYRILHETGALASVMGGIDGFVFTGGIGENTAPVRSRVCRGLAWLGLEFDDVANSRHGPCISKPKSRLSAWVVPTDEERMIARHTHEIRSTLMTV
jgi:acetate kinase